MYKFVYVAVQNKKLTIFFSWEAMAVHSVGWPLIPYLISLVLCMKKKNSAKILIKSRLRQTVSDEVRSIVTILIIAQCT